MPEISPARYLVQAGWSDCPHLDEKTKAELRASTLPHMREAREFGIPSLGSGAIYPIAVEEVTVKPFPIPAWYPKGYGLDVGWKRTAAVFGAWDRESDTIYVYSEYYAGQQVPTVHAAGIKARGAWLPGKIDPASRGRGQRDGEQLLEDYRAAALNVEPATNAVEAGLLAVWDRLASGRLKIFTSCQNTLAEYRLYRRDDKGKIVKEFDHAMDALRYLVVDGPHWFTTAPVARPVQSIGAFDRRAGM